jgi:DNA-binding MarR family transcriptional regulator
MNSSTISPNLSPNPTVRTLRPDLPNSLRKYDDNGDNWLSVDEIQRIQQLPKQELDEISENIAYAVMLEIFAAAKSAPDILVPTAGISFEEFRILMCLQKAAVKKELVIQDNLVTELRLSPSRISSILNSMDAALSHARAWIKRKDNPARRREKLLSITDEGERILEEARDGYMHQIYKLFETIGLRDLIQLRIFLFRLNSALNTKYESADLDLEGQVGG